MVGDKLQVASGVLYIVATPIGNLEDITLRALRILKEVDFILCEDKRITIRLLNKYEIKTSLISFHKFNEKKEINKILSLLAGGKNIALVSDAGTPLISDPGGYLVQEARKNNITIVPIPGASVLSGFLSVLPFNLDEFLFLGFLPDKKSKRSEIISSLSRRAKNIILFISPHDLSKYLNEICNFYPDVEIFYGRELTKIFEEFCFGKIKDLVHDLKTKKIKGEIVICLHFNSDTSNHKPNKDESLKEMEKYIKAGHSLKEASKYFAKEFNISSKYLYDLYVKNNEGRFM